MAASDDEQALNEGVNMRLGVIGLGSIGKRHVTNLLEMGGHDILGCDARLGTDGWMSGLTIHAVSSVGAVWDWEPEIVIIATPPGSHYQLARETLRNMAHCFIEKPIAMNVHDAKRLCTVAENNKLHVAVGYQLLACPSVQQFPKNWTHLHIWDRQNMARWPRASYTRDLLLEFSHEVSLALFWAGSAPSQTNIDWVNPARCAMQLEWNDGRTAQIELNGNFDGYERGALSDHGSWTFDREENDEAYISEIKAFLHGVPYCTGYDAFQVLQIMDKLVC